MLKIDNKKLAFAIWILGIIISLNFLVLTFHYGVSIYGYPIRYLLSDALPVVFNIWLGIIVLRNKNDNLTMFSVLLLGFTLNIPVAAAIIIRFIYYMTKNEKVCKLWFIPAVLAAGLCVWKLSTYNTYIIFMAFPVLNVMSEVGWVAYSVVFGYWLIKYLKLNKAPDART